MAVVCIAKIMQPQQVKTMTRSQIGPPRVRFEDVCLGSVTEKNYIFGTKTKYEGLSLFPDTWYVATRRGWRNSAIHRVELLGQGLVHVWICFPCAWLAQTPERSNTPTTSPPLITYPSWDFVGES